MKFRISRAFFMAYFAVYHQCFVPSFTLHFAGSWFGSGSYCWNTVQWQQVLINKSLKLHSDNFSEEYLQCRFCVLGHLKYVCPYFLAPPNCFLMARIICRNLVLPVHMWHIFVVLLYSWLHHSLATHASCVTHNSFKFCQDEQNICFVFRLCHSHIIWLLTLMFILWEFWFSV